MNKKYERYINYIVNDIEAPYFINMKEMYGLRPEEYELVLSKVYNHPVNIKGGMVYNQLGDIIYNEDSNNSWSKWEYDDQRNQIYYENSNGYWWKMKYDDQGNKIYLKDSDGYWWKKEYDDQRNEIYFEDSNGYWEKKEYNEHGNRIYFEDSNGNIRDNR